MADEVDSGVFAASAAECGACWDDHHMTVQELASGWDALGQIEVCKHQQALGLAVLERECNAEHYPSRRRLDRLSAVDLASLKGDVTGQPERGVG